MGLNKAGEVSRIDAYAVGIGAWDKRAIRYGYAQFADPAQALAAHLAENRQQGYEFIADPDARAMSDCHPRAHLWDNGADAAAELERVMALRAVALARFGAASLPPGAPLSDLQEAIVPVFLFHRFQVEAAAKALGGVDYRYALNGDSPQPAATAVPPARPRWRHCWPPWTPQRSPCRPNCWRTFRPKPTATSAIASRPRRAPARSSIR